MKLVPLTTARAQFGSPEKFGAGPLGFRTYTPFKGGTLEGPLLKGQFLPVGGEFGLTDAHGVFRPDVHGVIETEDGAHIYIQINGVHAVNEAAMAKGIVRRETAFGEDYFMMQVRLETGDARYDWINRVIVVGEARFLQDFMTEVRFYELQND